MLLQGCAAEPPRASPEPDCLKYHWTRVLPGSGLEASVAADGSIVVVSDVAGLQQISVLNRDGQIIGSFPIGPFSSVVRAGAEGRVVGAAADGRIRSFAFDGSVQWTRALEHAVADLSVQPDGGVVVSLSAGRGLVTFLDQTGEPIRSLAVRTAPFVSIDDAGGVALTSRDACSLEMPCGTGFNPEASTVTPATDAGGSQTSAIVLLDNSGRTGGGYVSSIDAGQPLGPLYIRAGLLDSTSVVVQATALSSVRERKAIDIDPGLATSVRHVDTESAPDRLLALAGGKLAWDLGIEPFDDSGRAHIVGLFANSTGVVVDVNGDVYKTHRIVKLAPDGQLLFRYDKANDGIANDVRLAGLDGSGRIVLSGRFEGTQDFNPGSAADVFSASADARRYVSVLSDCARTAL